MSSTRWRALRRWATVVAGTTAVVLASAGAALAFPSGGNPTDPGNGPATGPNHIEWTGNGSDSISANGSGGGCSAATESEIGQQANQPYLYWVFSPDGGTVTEDTANPSNPLNPVLHLSGTGSGQYPFSLDPSKAIKFVTPYFAPDPSQLQASVTMNIITDGGGAWTLKISHGCAPPAIVEGSPLSISKDAAGAFTTTYQWTVAKTTSTPTIDASPGGTATASYHVVVTNTGNSNSNITVFGHVTIHNPNPYSVSLSGAGNGVNDTLSNGVPCAMPNAPPSLDPGDNTFSYSCPLPDGTSTADLSGLTNHITVTWAEQSPDATHHLAGGSADFTTPNPIQFQQNLADNCVTVSDNQPNNVLPAQVCLGDLDSNGQKTFDYTVDYTAPSGADAGTCAPHRNVVTIADLNGNSLGSDHADVNVCSGADLVVTKDATPSLTRTYDWTLGKAVLNGPTIETSGSATANYELTVSNTGSTDSNWLVTGTIHVHNPNTWADDISLTGLSDAINNSADPGICTLNGGDATGTVIHAGETKDFGYTCTYQHAPTGPDFINTATATWNASAAFTSDGSASGTAQDSFNGPNTVITAKDSQVSVDDPQAPHPPAPWTVSLSDLDNNGQKTLDYSVTYPNDPAGRCTTHPNRAILTTKDTGTTVQADASVTVCVGADLTVTKTATTSFNRTYKWNVTKSADKTQLLDGGKVNYTINVNQTGVQDSNWQTSGTVTVTNPNNWEPITLSTAGVADSLDNGGICHFTGSPLPGGAVIPAGQSVTFSYTCTYTSQPKYSGTNTATASWDSGLFFTPHGSAQGTAPVNFTTPAHVFDKTITVSDPMAPNPPLPATLTGTDQAPFTSAQYTYSKTFPVPSSGCVDTTNTATISTTPPQSSQVTVHNCTLGALTMGFWHNQNGQAIIKADPGTALSSYLRAFTMFQDLPAGSTSAQVASYFQTVFNLANAAGNGAPMLKAQTLATALNVYFSTTGNNKIGAPNPIGGVTVNTTAWSAAFGGQTSMTVTQMLQFVSGVSTVGGTSFYSGDKNKTSLAIGAFTAVNQNQVTGP